MTGIEKIIDDLAWRGPNGRLMGHVVLTRAQAEEVLAEIEQLRSGVVKQSDPPPRPEPSVPFRKG
jgi:hypothetical protein